MTTETVSSPESIHRGMTFGFYARRGVFASSWTKQEVAKIAALSIRHVCLVVTVYRETDASANHYLDFAESPGELETCRLIDLFHEHGIAVMLRPMLESQEGGGRLEVWFSPDQERIPGKSSAYWAKFFQAMRARTKMFAGIARMTGCESYCLDSELDRTVGKNQHWLDVIEVARNEFSGPITSCHTHQLNFEQELSRKEHWFHQLDFLQTSFYRKAEDEPGADVEMMCRKLEEPLALYRRMAALYGKPIMFGECGCTSSSGGAMSPSSCAGAGSYAPLEQANYLEAVIRTFGGEPWWRGLYWWKWDEQNQRPSFSSDPAGDKGFIIDGKPAAEIFRQWCEGGL